MSVFFATETLGVIPTQAVGGKPTQNLAGSTRLASTSCATRAGKCPRKTKRIDIGLAILATKPLPSSGRTRREIAAYCGCSRERIRQIEEGALRRLRVRCIFLKDERLREAGEELLGRSVPL